MPTMQVEIMPPEGVNVKKEATSAEATMHVVAGKCGCRVEDFKAKGAPGSFTAIIFSPDVRNLPGYIASLQHALKKKERWTVGWIRKS